MKILSHGLASECPSPKPNGACPGHEIIETDIDRLIKKMPLIMGSKEILIPIAGTEWPVLKASFPLSEEAWENMIQLLQAMKPGLVKSTEENA